MARAEKGAGKGSATKRKERRQAKFNPGPGPQSVKPIGGADAAGFDDANVEAKMFVRQMRYGTGSMFSTLDSIACESHQAYRHARFWSLDGEFLDDVDPLLSPCDELCVCILPRLPDVPLV